MSSATVFIIRSHTCPVAQEGLSGEMPSPTRMPSKHSPATPFVAGFLTTRTEPETTDLLRVEHEELWLDREHQARVSRVEACDSAEGRKALAEIEMGLLEEETQYLVGERKAQGSDEYVNAIRRSGWFPYLDALHRSARLVWVLDMLLWGGLWASILWQFVRAYSHA